MEKIWENKKCYYKIKPEFIKGGGCLTFYASKFGNLSSIIYNSLYQIAPPLKEMIKFFKELVRVLHAINKPIIWITPSLMKITMSTRIFKSVKTSTKLFKSAKPIAIAIPTENLDLKTNQRGFSVNMIHSLDAANIHILIRKISENKYDMPLYTIHDCFATTPNQMLRLNNLILASFIELYFESNYIENVYKNLLEQIRSYGHEIHEIEDKKFIYHPKSEKQIIIPNIPKQILSEWELNKEFFIKNIKKSKYFIY